MRIARFVVLGLVVAGSVSAVAMAVDKQDSAKQTKEDVPEATATVTGVLHTTADGYAVGSRNGQLWATVVRRELGSDQGSAWEIGDSDRQRG